MTDGLDQVDLCCRGDGGLQPYVWNFSSLRCGHIDLGTSLVLTSKHSGSMG